MLNRRGFLKGIFGAVALIAAAPALRVIGISAPETYVGTGGAQSVELGFPVRTVFVVKAGDVPGGMPPGAVVPYRADVPPPEGWILCDGRAVLKGTYAGLEEALGGRFGRFPYGETPLTYNVPDLRGGLKWERR